MPTDTGKGAAQSSTPLTTDQRNWFQKLVDDAVRGQKVLITNPSAAPGDFQKGATTVATTATNAATSALNAPLDWVKGISVPLGWGMLGVITVIIGVVFLIAANKRVREAGASVGKIAAVA